MAILSLSLLNIFVGATTLLNCTSISIYLNNLLSCNNLYGTSTWLLVFLFIILSSLKKYLIIWFQVFHWRLGPSFWDKPCVWNACMHRRLVESLLRPTGYIAWYGELGCRAFASTYTRKRSIIIESSSHHRNHITVTRITVLYSDAHLPSPCFSTTTTKKTFLVGIDTEPTKSNILCHFVALLLDFLVTRPIILHYKA